MRQTNLSKNERGMALILSLLALLLISAVGLGLVYMSNTETSINANYKDTQAAFFAMRAGLEEGRDRLRSNSPAPTIPLPTVAPPRRVLLSTSSIPLVAGISLLRPLLVTHTLMMSFATNRSALCRT